MEKNRINFAKLQILSYVESLFTCISDLVHPELGGLMNMPVHGLTRVELVVVLHEMFEKHLLVAKKEGRNFFTPTLVELESALQETNDLNYRSSNTFYGLTTAALDVLTELRAIYNEEQNVKRHCSFCARSLDDARLLVEGIDNVRICDLCIERLHGGIAILPPGA